jgi:hypothetical protein
MIKQVVHIITPDLRKVRLFAIVSSPVFQFVRKFLSCTLISHSSVRASLSHSKRTILARTVQQFFFWNSTHFSPLRCLHFVSDLNICVLEPIWRSHFSCYWVSLILRDIQNVSPSSKIRFTCDTALLPHSFISAGETKPCWGCSGATCSLLSEWNIIYEENFHSSSEAGPPFNDFTPCPFVST